MDQQRSLWLVDHGSGHMVPCAPMQVPLPFTRSSLGSSRPICLSILLGVFVVPSMCLSPLMHLGVFPGLLCSSFAWPCMHLHCTLSGVLLLLPRQDLCIHKSPPPRTSEIRPRALPAPTRYFPSSLPSSQPRAPPVDGGGISGFPPVHAPFRTRDVERETEGEARSSDRWRRRRDPRRLERSEAFAPRGVRRRRT